MREALSNVSIRAMFGMLTLVECDLSGSLSLVSSFRLSLLDDLERRNGFLIDKKRHMVSVQRRVIHYWEGYFIIKFNTTLLPRKKKVLLWRGKRGSSHPTKY